MSTTLTINDGTVFGDKKEVLQLEGLTEEMTVRELIRARIYQEVQDWNQRQPEIYFGLVQPVDAEQTLNGYRPKKTRTINWETQFEQACKAFESNGFFILIDKHQAESLDESFTVKLESEITFVKLVPLVGG